MSEPTSNTAKPAQGQVRRIVTGHDDQGRSIVSEDGFAPVTKTNPKRVGYCMTELWMTTQMPVPVDNASDPTFSRPVTLEPPKNGTVVRIVEFGPEGEWMREIGTAGAREAWNAIGTDSASTNRAGGGKHPFMHRTQSVDYCMVLEGEIVLMLDQEEVLMRTGDFAVERGTNHAWANRSDKPCKLLFVLIDGQFDPELAKRFPAAT